MEGIPKPMYFVVPSNITASATTIPPIKGRKGAYLMYFLKEVEKK